MVAGEEGRHTVNDRRPAALCPAAPAAAVQQETCQFTHSAAADIGTG